MGKQKGDLRPWVIDAFGKLIRKDAFKRLREMIPCS
jgi:hypothetical protein